MHNNVFGFNSVPNDKESQYSNQFYNNNNNNQVATIPSFTPEDQTHEYDQERQVSNFLNTSTQQPSKEQRPNFFFKQQRRLIKAREMRENNFASLNGSKTNHNQHPSSSIKTPIWNVYYSQNSEQLKETLNQIKDKKYPGNESAFV